MSSVSSPPTGGAVKTIKCIDNTILYSLIGQNVFLTFLHVRPLTFFLRFCSDVVCRLCSFPRFVYLMVTNYDMQLRDAHAQMPEVDASRYGLGLLQPVGDLNFRYRPRETH